MIETALIRFLNDHDLPAYLEHEENMPQEYVIVEKIGGSETDHVPSAILALQSYSSTLLGAAELNERLKQLMKSFAELDTICRVALNSDYNYTDTETKQYRYQAVYEIKYY